MDTQLISRMQNLVNSRVNDDTSKNIANYILQNLYGIDNLTISELATKTYTSTASISRFVRTIGCENFNDMKQRIADDSNIVEAFNTNLKIVNFKENRPIKLYSENIIKALRNMEEKFNLEEIDALVKEIHDNENVYFLGHNFPALLAQNAQRALILAGKYVEAYDSASIHLDVAKSCPKDALVIVFSMNSQYLFLNKEVRDIFSKRHIRLVLITQDEKPAFESYFDEIIKVGDQFDANAGRYKLELFLETLVNRYVDLYFKK